MHSRRSFLKSIPLILSAPSLIVRPNVAAANPLAGGRSITSVSWIDAEGLPSASIFQTSVLGWPFRVAVGLTGTQNPRPPATLPASFRSSKQFRAMTHFDIDGAGNVTGSFTDPGYTPPFDVGKVRNIAGAIAWASDDGGFHPGEQSSISSVMPAKLHSSSTLEPPSDARVLASALVKFRAGTHTNRVGLEKAGSPYHVPWVWCEHALIQVGDKLVLIANGSAFPSHSWHVDGKIVGTVLQDDVTINERDPALATGAPASESLPSVNEKGVSGPVSGHKYTVGKKRSAQISLSVP